MIESYELWRWLHVLVMGYWLGSDIVVNAVTHYTTHAERLTPAERDRLWRFLLQIDQHPRNAMILSVPLGFTLAEQLGLVPFGGAGLGLVWTASALWFAFMWLVHLRSGTASGPALRAWDWRLRCLLIALFGGLGGYSLATGHAVAAPWLAAKLVLFAGVIACGLRIRYYIGRVVEAWPAFLRSGSTPGFEQRIRAAMWRGTRVLWLLWAQLFAIGYLGAARPGW